MATEYDTPVIRTLSDDTDVFVLLLYWVYRQKFQARVQRWDGAVWDINATCAELGPKCLQIMGMHYLTGSDTTSYLYGKGKVSALNTLRAGDFSGLYSALGEVDATHTQLMEAGQAFFCALYGQQEGHMMSQARYRLYTRKCGKLLKLMSLPPTERNLLLHIVRAQLQTILAKSADQQVPPELDITKYGWEIKDGIPVQGRTQDFRRGGGGRLTPYIPPFLLVSSEVSHVVEDNNTPTPFLPLFHVWKG